MPHRAAGTPGVGSLLLRAQVNPANHVLLCARVRGGACTRRERARKNRERWEGLGTGKGSGEDEGEPVDMEKGRDRGLGVYTFRYTFRCLSFWPVDMSSLSQRRGKTARYCAAESRFPPRFLPRVTSLVGPFRARGTRPSSSRHPLFLACFLSVYCSRIELSPSAAILRETPRRVKSRTLKRERIGTNL